MSPGGHVGGARLSTLKLARVLTRLAATLSARDSKHGQVLLVTLPELLLTTTVNCSLLFCKVRTGVV